MFRMCSALRLARFNTALLADTPPPAWTGSYFTGVPAPAGALLALIPLMVSFEIEAAWPRHALVVGTVLVVVGGLMVSRLPTFSFKKGRVPRHLVLPLLLAVPLLAGAHYGWALVVILLNRLIDGLDGAIARRGSPSPFGGYLDIVCDMAFYAAVPFGFALARPANALWAALLLASFVCTAASFLGRAVMAVERGEADAGQRAQKSFFYAAGIIVRTDTTLAFLPF